MTTTFTLRIECIDTPDATQRVYKQLEAVLQSQPQNETTCMELTVDRPEPTRLMDGSAI
ncbi:hypothetical protein [Aeromicrobium sp. 9AM]|uniref:hypothetical protein n=1 Tax=Aeromicrobium sp. 9AM TaxID=2653126 RepID=UPI0012F2E0B3|nr:hypothetical protein [Aeromicrobium sp. 9AM]VXC21017.1 hypothetical protein AERO9AM_50368 [Aeromicrobium sp. 9AM]